MQTGLAADFTRLYKKYHPKVLADFKRLTGGSGDIDDLAQDVFLKLWRKSKEGQCFNSVEDWLYIVTYNRFIDYSKVKANIRKRNQRYRDSLSGIDSSNPVEYREKLNAVGEAVRNLSVKQKMVYQLVKSDGYRISEVADMVQMAEQTVKNHMVKATRNLREGLSELFDLSDRMRA